MLRGLLLIRTNEQAAGETVTRAACQRALEQSDAYWQAAAANNLGLDRMRGFRYDEAIPFLEQALKAADSVDAQRFSAASLANLGDCYYRIGEFDKALSFLQRAADSQERIGAMAGLQSSLGDIGNVHLMQGHADRADCVLQRALALARSNAPRDAAKWAGNLARAHAELKSGTQAEQFSSRIADAAADRRSRFGGLLDTRSGGDRGRTRPARAGDPPVRGDDRPGGRQCRARPGMRTPVWATCTLDAGRAAAGARRSSSGACRQSTLRAARLSRPDYKLTFFSRLIQFYQQYVDVLVASGADEQALQVADASRALLLSERLQLDGRQPLSSHEDGPAADGQAAERGLPVLLARRPSARSCGWSADTTFELGWSCRRATALPRWWTRTVSFIDTSVRDPISTALCARRASCTRCCWRPPDRSSPPARTSSSSPTVRCTRSISRPCRCSTGRRTTSSRSVTISVAPALALAAASTWPRLPEHGGAPSHRRSGAAGARLPPAAECRPRDSGHPGAIQHARRHRVDRSPRRRPAAFETSRPERFSIIHFAAHATANRASPLDSSVVLSPHADGLHAVGA